MKIYVYVYLVLGFFFINKTFAQIFEICPAPLSFDNSNCFLGTAPQGTRAFIFNNSFYHSKPAGTHCRTGSTFDGKNCYLGQVPPNYSPFIFNNGWYTRKNPILEQISVNCPAGFSFDSRSCFFEKAPQNRQASIISGHFAFKRSFYENCSKIDSRSYGLMDPFWCARMKVPDGTTPFVHANGWYVEPLPSKKEWISKYSANSAFNKDTRACLPHPKKKNWNLIWSDDFSPQAPNTPCFNSDKEALRCVTRDHWGFHICKDAPVNWQRQDLWTSQQRQKYKGLSDLNKCFWNVYDQFNQWEIGNTNGSQPTTRTSSLIPNLVKVQNGKLRITTSSYGPLNGKYDCGTQIDPNPSVNGSLYTKNCPYAGGNISTEFSKWELDNRVDHPDYRKRHVGRAFGYGRFEFRANVVQMGHGAFPALWLYVNDKAPNEPSLELDPMEGLLEYDIGNNITGRETYFRSIQTAHHWGKVHSSDSVTLPLKIGAWHTYAVEWNGVEIRFFIDDCLTNVITHGKLVDNNDNYGTKTTFTMPKNQKLNFIIGVPVSNKNWMPLWSRGQSPTGTEPRKDFIPTIMDVDYVRYYQLDTQSVGTSKN